MRFAAIDLSKLPAPEIVEKLDFETILAAGLADLQQRAPDFSAQDLESELSVKILEVFANREVLLRQDFNDRARQLLLAFATGANLDHRAAEIGVKRLVLDPGDPDATPPVPPTYETDDHLRLRTQLAPEAFTTAGSEGSYIFNGLSAGESPSRISVVSPEPGKIIITFEFSPTDIAAAVKDIRPTNPDAGEVTVAVLGWEGDGTPTEEVLTAVETHLSGLYVRPLTDLVTVQAAEILTYSVTGVLEVEEGPDADLIETASMAALEAYVEGQHRLGALVDDSGLHRAGKVEGVRRMTLTDWEDVDATALQAPYCTGITLTVVEVAS